MVVLNIDPMPALREAAKQRLDSAFNREAAAYAHRDAAYAAKRAAAAGVLQGVVSQQLAAEAALRGVAVEDLARDILSKPDMLEERETRRQAVLAQIRAAATKEQLDAIAPGKTGSW
ncbi:peptidase M23B [Rhodopseudomonas palustris TIE-1]|uniref:hypothetical protein n=1 Tax=Rhodopseudomonas palustris TaxID=1076 RepID=UPI000177974A|nr:hypothetical protein [Rhodopseudomonas palustris]ACF01839.1 peptidase M23B [Rhodopseudomonas palustris TIE-1]